MLTTMIRRLLVVKIGLLLTTLICQHPSCICHPLEHRSPYEDRNLADEFLILKRMLEREQTERELERQQRANKVHARLFLERFGYLAALKEDAQHEPASFNNAIKNMQRMYHLKVTGQLDQETVAMMEIPRCGMPDMTPKEYLNVSLTRSKSSGDMQIANNYYVPGYKWNKKHLTWRLKNIHPLLNEHVTRTAMRQAFKFWSDASQMTFKEVTSHADINMEFVRGVHQDGTGNAFDGPSGVLAHAFYPESGETHFDADEYWTDGTDEGTNLMIVAAHELGHALGLGHSNVQGALMAPFYQGYDPHFKLTIDDIFGIQSLYGVPISGQATLGSTHSATTKASTATKVPSTASKVPSTASTTTTTSTTTSSTTTKALITTNSKPTSATSKATSPPQDTCQVIYRAVTQTHDYRILIFSGRFFWRTSEYGLDSGFPVLINTYYEKPPEDISATIFSWRTYFTYFFKGNRVWKYYGYQLVDTTPKTIETQGYPANPKAALAKRDGTIQLIKDGNVWEWDENALDVKNPSTPTSMDQLYPGAPSNYDSIVRLYNEPNIYFFKGTNYYKYNEDDHRVTEGYPRPTAPVWMGIPCGGKPYTPK